MRFAGVSTSQLVAGEQGHPIPVFPYKLTFSYYSMSTRKIVCFPFAGAGASIFRPWISRLQPNFQVLSVQLPGREQLFAELPFTCVEEAINSVLPGLVKELDVASEVVLFGHSMGAVLAYELGRRLASRGDAGKYRLVVSGSPSPTQPRAEVATGLNDDAFVARVEHFAGYRHEALSDPDLREVLLPVLRADVEMHERYRPLNVEQLPLKVTCVRARGDNLVNDAEARAWQEVTSEPLDYVEVQGSHMYLVDDPSELIDLLIRSETALAEG